MSTACIGEGGGLREASEGVYQPSGAPSLKRVYSCSIPYQGTSSGALSKMALAAPRVLVGMGVMSGFSISQSTRMCGPPRMGSGHM